MIKNMNMIVFFFALQQLLVVMRTVQYTRSKDIWGNLEVKALTVTEHMNRAQLFEYVEVLRYLFDKL